MIEQFAINGIAKVWACVIDTIHDEELSDEKKVDVLESLSYMFFGMWEVLPDVDSKGNDLGMMAIKLHCLTAVVPLI